MEGQENLVHAIISEAEDTIQMAAKSIPQDSVIAFFNDQFTGGSGIMTVKVYDTSEIDEGRLEKLKESLPADQFLINGTFWNNEIGYYVILKMKSKELGLDSYLFMLIFLASVIAVALAVVAFFLSKKLTKPVTTLYKSAIDTREHELSSVPVENESKDEVSTIAAVFEEMNHDMRTSKELITTYSSAAKAYSLILFLEKNIPLSRFYETNENFRGCDKFLLCGVKLCNDVVASHYLLNLSRLISDFLGDETINLVSPLSQSTILILLGSNDDSEQLDKLAKDLYEMIDPLAKTRYIMGVTNITQDINALQRRSKQLDTIISTCEFHSAHNKIVTKDSITKLNSKNMQLMINDYYPRFVSSILENDRLGIELNADRFFNQLYLIEKDNCIEVIVKLIDKIVEEQSLADRTDPEYESVIKQKETLSDIKKYFAEIFIRASSYYERDINDELKLCENVASMLKANYSKDLDMLSIASRFSVSYSYLSKVFKNTMSMTLTDYLNKYRIDKSCEFLSDKSEKLESIAIKVGYNNIQSFHRFFKKYKGTTPTLYRKSVLND